MDTEGLNNTLDSFMLCHTIQRKARNYFSRSTEDADFPRLLFVKPANSRASWTFCVSICDTVTQCNVLYRPGTCKPS